jgi:hypothetical protein
MTTVVINTCFGGFNLSHEAILAYLQRKGIEVWPEDTSNSPVRYWLVPPGKRTVRLDRRGMMIHDKPWDKMTNSERTEENARYARELWCCDRDIPRDDPDLVAVVGELGTEKASGPLARLSLVEVPGGVRWQIEEYGGKEHIAEAHRTWS